ncbi:6-carboxy-5,6,7,8-tetrahydropterin synthase [Halobacteriovorax marinus]|uniref:6-carboxy-5,6,7,8-tetrahydropterin synthase n=1 Tax=Halobacteriovorax marinus TaxID=97084 RepID=A0A1Y5F205_9BACT|nr:6-carboxy-5,6,7,8-tetrahydropterin synthase [Halobacteriovorax marinus]
MNNITAFRKIHFCYGHRVLNHESKCANAHGHNGIIWVHATPNTKLDSLGRVVDFSVLKDIVGGWVDTNWDHTFILNKEDKELMDIKEVLTVNKKVYVCDFNPTAENLANHLLLDICPGLLKDYDVTVTKIVFEETENCKVEVTL